MPSNKFTAHKTKPNCCVGFEYRHVAPIMSAPNVLQGNGINHRLPYISQASFCSECKEALHGNV